MCNIWHHGLVMMVLNCDIMCNEIVLNNHDILAENGC